MKRALKIKVCGMRDADNIRELTKLFPDYIGFIFYAKSKRYAGDVLDVDVVKSIPSTIKKVGVFVNEAYEQIVNAVETYGLDVVQLHGEESPDLCRRLKECDLELVKAFSIETKDDLNAIAAYKGVCDFVLFDTKSKGYGGSGKKFDWTVLSAYNHSMPVFLSGGIDSGDESELMELSNTMPISVVDINSRFEIAPGLKDVDKVREFVATIRL